MSRAIRGARGYAVFFLALIPPVESKIRVLLADSQAMIRDTLAFYLDARGDLEVVATACDGQEAVALCQRTNPDVAVIEVAMPQLNGIDATEQICRHCPSVGIVMISQQSSLEFVYRALRAGARGFVSKAAAASDLECAIRCVRAGQRYLSEGITESLLDRYQLDHMGKTPFDRLSARERQILQFIAEGRSSAAVARMLALSPKTIDTYRSRIMEKLGIAEMPALIKFAIHHGLTTLD